MNKYIGIDIGTTNAKVLSVSSDGRFECTLNIHTPLVIEHGVEYIDLLKLQEILLEHLDYLREHTTIASISVASIGETVVPLRKGRPLWNPIVWYEPCTNETSKKIREQIMPFVEYKYVGMPYDNSTFSLYKILWMKENLKIEDEECWIPLSSYFLYILGARIVWAESQACRSLMYDIHKRVWLQELLSFFELEDKLGPIVYSGTLVGTTKDDIALVMSGHDHITGLQGISLLANTQSIIYQSMGTSSVTAMLTENKNHLFFEEPFLKDNKGIIGAAFADNIYFLQNSFKFFGSIISQIFSFKNINFDIATIDAINKKIQDNLQMSTPVMFMGERDPIFENYFSGVTYINLPQNPTIEFLIQSCYIYLSLASAKIVEQLKEFLLEDARYFVGGAMAQNQLLMRYIASAIQSPVEIPLVQEVTSLGAVLASMQALEAKDDITQFRENIGIQIIEPESNITVFMGAMQEKYEMLIKQNKNI